MRWTLWFIGLFGIAVATALFVSGNDGTVTVYWPPHRVDLSLNMVVLVLVLLFGLIHFALRASSWTMIRAMRYTRVDSCKFRRSRASPT